MILESALYTKLSAFKANAAYVPDLFESLLAEELKQHMVALDSVLKEPIQRHFMTSTVLTGSMNRPQPSWQGLNLAIQKEGGIEPVCSINAYECAGWGYIFRLMKQLKLINTPVLISILDINAFDMTCWNYHPQWGQSGFGLASLAVRMTEEDLQTNDLHISASTGANPFNHFALAVRKELMSDQNLCAAMPFFPKATQTLFDRILADYPHLPDRHPMWGHCFGSDPWLSMILSHQEGYDFAQHSKLLACSLAFSGYFSLAKIKLAENGLFKVIPSINGGRL